MGDVIVNVKILVEWSNDMKNYYCRYFYRQRLQKKQVCERVHTCFRISC